jgi:hypothetical protein
MSHPLQPSIMSLVDLRVAEAIAKGEFDNLPGAGKPLELDDDSHVPEEERAAYRLLKNSGFVPPELAEISEIYALLAQIERDEYAGEAAGESGKRLRALLIKLELAGRPVSARSAWGAYEAALRKKSGTDAT